MMQLRPSDSRGFADHGWLLERHSFSFGDYFKLDAIRYAEGQPFVRLWRDGAWRDQPVTLGAQGEGGVGVRVDARTEDDLAVMTK